MPHTPLSVTLIAFNEEKKIARAIESVAWADDILVVDSGSTDKTTTIAKSLGARVLYNPWPGYGKQKNFAQAHALHPWVLNIDADETVPESLAKKIRKSLDEIPAEGGLIHGFEMPRKTFYLGRWIRHGGWYPNYLTRLANKNFARWTEPQVHERLEIDGQTKRLEEPLFHDAFDTIGDQILTNLRFATLGAEDLVRKNKLPSLLKLIVKPSWKFFDTYVLKMGFLDGLPGFIISINAAHSMFLKYAFLTETALREKAKHTTQSIENS
jgi:glycosyltransferase involved in cell wall biosynthesis